MNRTISSYIYDPVSFMLQAISHCFQESFVVSWNFKHIVHYEKIAGYQAVNLLNGYKEIRIYSPKEVVGNEKR